LFKPEGIMPALVTPFTYDQRTVDEEKLRFLVNRCIKNGVHGVVACGTTGEFTSLTTEERKRAVKIVVDEVNGKVPVIAGTGASATQQALELTKYAKDTGVQAALIVTPYYLKVSDRGIYDHYSTITSAVDLPIILYNIPQCTGNSLSWQLVEDLAQLPNIVGLKDSSAQLTLTMSVLEKVRDKINVLCGNDELVTPALAAGCSGAILASANIIPDIWIQIYNHVKSGELQAARELQFKVQKIARIIAASGAVAVKEALNMMKVNVGTTRKPLSVGGELTFENREELKLELERLGKIPPKPTMAEQVWKPIEERFADIELQPETIIASKLKVAEAQAGEGTETAHIDLVMGSRTGPVGEAFVKAKATPTLGHEPLFAILEPNLSVKPATLIVPTVTVKNMRQASMVFGPAQSAVAKAVVDSVTDGTISRDIVEDLMIIVNVFVHPAAIDRQRVYLNNYKAMRHAIRKAIEGRPDMDELIEEKELSRHPLKYTP
jgi:4-hydroxy-tetrahydrodipicolinate synthase